MMTDDRLLALLKPSSESPPSAAWSSSSSSPMDDIRAAIKKLRDEPPVYTICVNSNQHVVSPHAMQQKGLATCANCFAPVWLGEPD